MLALIIVFSFSLPVFAEEVAGEDVQAEEVVANPGDDAGGDTVYVDTAADTGDIDVDNADSTDNQTDDAAAGTEDPAADNADGTGDQTDDTAADTVDANSETDSNQTSETETAAQADGTNAAAQADDTTADGEDASESGSDGTQTWPADPGVEAEAIYLVETNTKSVLHKKNEEEKMYPASTTKILTCLLALENCSLDEIVTFSESAVDLEEGDSNIGAVAGEQMSMRDVLFGLMIPSGNECANAIAEHIAGSVEAFAEMMNEKAAELGCTNSHFTNPSGLYNINHYTCAKDLAIIAMEAGNNSTFIDIISHDSYVIEPTNMDPNQKILETTDALIDPGNSYYTDYVIGGKTGYLMEAGRCLVSFAKKNGMTLLSVLLNSGYEAVFPETIKNFEYGFNNFSLKNISENETRFSFMNEKNKVYLDNKSQLLAINSVPFDELTVDIEFVSDMDEETRNQLFEEVGMSVDSPLRLYARLKYSYAGHKLGSVNVLINPDKEIITASFVNVRYVNPVYIVIGAVVIIIILIIVARRPKASKYRR